MSASNDEMRELLEDCLEFLKNYEDVDDGDYGFPKPNRAMILATEIRRALGGSLR